MTNWQEDVRKFHEKFDCKIGRTPNFSDSDEMRLRFSLIEEEILELKEAYRNNDLSSFVDALADSIYVLLGTSVSIGVDLNPIWNEVQRTNMAKIPGNSRKDGKVLKPKNWDPPDIKDLLTKQGWEDR
jgi:predicted HAD superfamily Cof-like phosphohydrolase